MLTQITYLSNSGFAVKTKRHFLIFDCWNRKTANGKRGLSGGVIDPEEIKDKNVVVFVSHAHGDHYNPMIFEWAKIIPKIRYILSDDIRSQLGAQMVSPDEEYEIDGMNVKTLRSTDEGVAFLVKVDGLTFYHAGDLNWWHWEGEDPHWNADMARDYQNEIKKLSGEHIDIAFVPVDPRLRDSMLMGVVYFMEHVNAKMVIPMHYGSEDRAACRALRDTEELYRFKTQIVLPMRRGETLLWEG